MRRWGKVIMFVIGCVSIAQAGTYYEAMYEEARAHGKVVEVVASERLAAVKERAVDYLRVLGYRLPSDADSAQPVLAFEKKIEGADTLMLKDDRPCQILVKLTAATQHRTLVEMVRLSDTPLTNREVNKDIATLAEMLKQLKP